MKRPSRTPTAVAAAALAALALAALAAGSLLSPAVAAGPTTIEPTKIEPAKLARGADLKVAHLEGRTVVDGDVRVPVAGGVPFLLGTSGNGYVLLLRASDHYQVVRVAPERSQRTLLDDLPGQIVVSDDGETFAVTSGELEAKVDIRSARSGRLVGTGNFTGHPRILDLDGDHVVVASFSQGAVDYDWRADNRSTITLKAAYAADLSSNLLAYFTEDPYNGGCSIVTSLTAPSTRLWRSCRERVTEFSPDGERIATVHKLSDGPGPSIVWERTIRGGLLGSYSVGSYFSGIEWETSTDLVMEANAQKKAATVRCSEGECERASAVRPTPDL